MIYRDELFQAHQRIQRLEQELYAARARNALREEQLAQHAQHLLRGRAVPRRATYAPADEAGLSRWAWWPLLVMVAGILGYLLAFGAVLPEAPFADDLPYDWAIVSGIAGATIYALDVALRWHGDGERSLLGRLIVVIAVVVSLPALALTAFGLGPILGLVAAVGTAVAGMVALVLWIIQGTAS